MEQDTNEPHVPVKRKVSMLEYCMTILTKLSFDKTLFRKEYHKALRYLKPTEQEKLRSWVRENQ